MESPLLKEFWQAVEVAFVLRTVAELVERHGCTLDDTTIVHSDQGCHYTSKAFIKAISEQKLVQSMSRRANCWDNAPQESFFGHMKDEIGDKIKEATSFFQIKELPV